MNMTSTETIPGYVAGTWAIDPEHSEIGFSVRHMMICTARGKFTRFSGELVTAPDVFSSSVTAEIDLASFRTGNPLRDAIVRSADFFDADNHPQMTYRSTGLRLEGDHYVLEGELTLKGVTKNVPLTLEASGFGPDMRGETRADFTATGEISKQDFGVRCVGVADQVTIHLKIEAMLHRQADQRKP